jgi:phosphoglycerate dehydrogenase-like enzyme
MKERMMVEGIREISDCTIGLIGFGDIAKATAERLVPFGCKLVYTAQSRKDAETEERYHVHYLPLNELIAVSDVVSLHVPVTEQTRGMVNAAFLHQMKQDALLINTSRGDLVDNMALRQALIDGTILGAGLDTIYPEPTPADHPLVALPEECADRVIYSPHIGGITTSSFRRSHRMIWQGFDDYCHGIRPKNIVNGI